MHGSSFGCDPKAGYFRQVYLADEQTLDGAFIGLADFMAKSSSAIVAR